MPDRIVLHVGTHKTGTTSLQHFLHRERDGLLATAGIGYPEGMVLPASHAELPLLAIRTDRMWPARLRLPEVREPSWLDAARRHVRSVVTDPATASTVLSHEDLSYLRFDDELERLHELLAPAVVRVVVYLRDPTTFLRSYREQLAATGFPESHDPRSFAYVAEDSWLVDYEALVDGYRRGFGPTAVEVIDYDDVMRRDGSVLPSFADTIGLDRSVLPLAEPFLNQAGQHLRPSDDQLTALRHRLADQAEGHR